MATNIVKFHHDPQNGGFFTTSLFWDCECEQRYIHDLTESECLLRRSAPGCAGCACDRSRSIRT